MVVVVLGMETLSAEIGPREPVVLSMVYVLSRHLSSIFPNLWLVLWEYNGTLWNRMPKWAMCWTSCISSAGSFGCPSKCETRRFQYCWASWCSSDARRSYAERTSHFP